MNFETLCLHAGYTPKNGEPRALPIVQSTTFTYDSAESIGKLFDLEEAGFFYTRLANPTTILFQHPAFTAAVITYSHIRSAKWGLK